MLAKFGINTEEYSNLLEKQGNKCSICKTDNSNLKKSLAVDHDHVTGKIRGLLCTNCNIGLGHFKDDITLLEESIKYLKLNKGS